MFTPIAVDQTNDLPNDPTIGDAAAEHLLVTAWRRIVAGGGPCPLVARLFADACGDDAAEVVATFDTFLRALACAGRRRLRMGHPGSAGLTGDERQLLALIAAAQAGDADRVDAHLRWLARQHFQPALSIAARALAAALDTHGYRLTAAADPAARSDRDRRP